MKLQSRKKFFTEHPIFLLQKRTPLRQATDWMKQKRKSSLLKRETGNVIKMKTPHRQRPRLRMHSAVEKILPLLLM